MTSCCNSNQLSRIFCNLTLFTVLKSSFWFNQSDQNNFKIKAKLSIIINYKTKCENSSFIIKTWYIFLVLLIHCLYLGYRIQDINIYDFFLFSFAISVHFFYWCLEKYLIIMLQFLSSVKSFQISIKSCTSENVGWIKISITPLYSI